MRLFKLLLISIVVYSCFSAFSATLIVTHPETIWDESKAAGPATKKHLQDKKFDKKIVLTTGEDFTFSKKGLVFQSIRSENGDFKWNGKESDLYVAGGFFDECFFNSLTSIISGSKSHSNLKIHVLMNATYIIQNEDYTTATLSTNSKKYPKKFHNVILKNFMDSFMVSRYWLAFNPKEIYIEENNQAKKAFTIEFIFDGKVISTVGEGPKFVSIIFEDSIN